MINRYILDGPPGSGKTTLLFGVSDSGHEIEVISNTLSSKYRCIHESMAEANRILIHQGIDQKHNMQTWLKTIVELDREKFKKAEDGINFYDRSFHHWKILSQLQGIKLPDWYDETNQKIKYSDPVFITAPIKSIDMSGHNIPETHRCSWCQRQTIYMHTKETYEKLGYRTIKVPVFVDGDIESNNQKRIEFILKNTAQ